MSKHLKSVISKIIDVATACMWIWAGRKIISSISTKKGASKAEDDSEKLSLKDQMDYAMEHFNFIAEQRIKFFNFYILVVTASLTATVTIFSKSLDGFMLVMAGTFHLIISIVFHMIEKRNTRLLAIARMGVVQIEESANWPKKLQLAIYDKNENNKHFIKNGLYSFKFAFSFTHALHCLAGLGLIVIGLFLISGYKFLSQGQQSKQNTQYYENYQPCSDL